MRVLREVGHIAAEDTRTTRKLLSRHGVQTPLVSFHEHTAPQKRATLVQRLDTEDMALVTDAGTPGVSDPGAALVADALAAGHDVVPIPGPSAVATALSVAALPADTYVFVGFLPRRGSDRRTELASLAAERRTLVAFEAPHRLRESLRDMADVLGDRQMAVGRELTKSHEQVFRGSLGEAIAHWSEVEPRGEFTLVVAGAPESSPEPWTADEVASALEELREEGVSAREASRRIAEMSGLPAREIYRLWHEGG